MKYITHCVYSLCNVRVEDIEKYDYGNIKQLKEQIVVAYDLLYPQYCIKLNLKSLSEPEARNN